jgi:hypothetical protein
MLKTNSSVTSAAGNKARCHFNVPMVCLFYGSGALGDELRPCSLQKDNL